jgi:hypothetical protein
LVLNLFFLVVAERPKEAPARALEKNISNRELATNSWKRHIKILIVKKISEQMKHLLNLFY